MENNKHTKEKWYLEDRARGTGQGFETDIVTDKLVIATMNRHGSNSNGELVYTKEQEQNAIFICKAVNEYDKLKEDNALLIEMLEKVTSELHYQIKSRGGEVFANTHWAVSQAKELLTKLKK